MHGNWIATYRLQLHAGFPLDQARQVLPYLADLGISHVYLSACLQAVPGSQHGYDVTDPTRISEDLGGEPAWSAFINGARSHGLRVLLDIVPNHMSASAFDPWWDDVLSDGPFSAYAERRSQAEGKLAEADRSGETEAVQSARIGAPEIEPAAFDFLAALLGKSRLSDAEAAWRNCFTDAVLQREATPDALFGAFPVALLIREAA